MNIKRREGRKGGPQEYVQFDTPRNSYIAQQSGSESHWFVFKMGRFGDRPVSTLAGPMHKDSAVTEAERFAKAE